MIGKLIMITEGEKHCLSHAYDNVIGIVIPRCTKEVCWIGEIRIVGDIQQCCLKEMV